MEWIAQWIKASFDDKDVCPVYIKNFVAKKAIKAELYVTAMGVYEAHLNGERVGGFVLAPGWTSYKKRLQYQKYDVTTLLEDENKLEIVVGRGWYRGTMPGWNEDDENQRRREAPAGLLAQLHIMWEDGTEELILTDDSWMVAESKIRCSEIYDGETYNASIDVSVLGQAECFDYPIEQLILQQGEYVTEHEYIKAASIFTTPGGETIVDFGQNIAGYVQFTVNAKAGDKIEISHGEVLDKEGNLYNANYRDAKAKIYYTCKEGVQTYHPKLTFFGFRYIRLDQFPGNPVPEQFTAIVLHSDIKRTGYFKSSDKLLNQFYTNVIWGQKSNFVDIPMDCPQRNERMGWTGDAQIFIKAASYNYDVEKFFTKWLGDMCADQDEDGSIRHIIPKMLEGNGSAGWDDASAICPWQLYMTYGNTDVLQSQFICMKKHIDYITNTTKDKYLWTGGTHYGDWLGLDAPSGSYKGSSREDFIASAFYAYSTSIVVKVGKIIGKDVSEYEDLYENIVKTFRNTYTDYRTQTEHVLAVQFGLAPNPQKTADDLANMIVACGNKMQTGFIGTPYLLHVLSNYGHTDLAYTLLLRKEYPSWFYQVTKGATTVWEHLDSIMENGEFWSTNMNSFNHYAFGSVVDWIYEVVAGIKPVEEAPGFAEIRVEPKPDERLDWIEASINTRKGTVRSFWQWVEHNGKDRKIRYEITVPSPATIVINGVERKVNAGEYIFYS